jgi:ferritin-like protein
MKKKSARPESNKTGIMDKGKNAKESIRGAREGKPSSRGGVEEMNRMRTEAILESGPVGTLPSNEDMLEAMMKLAMKSPGKFLAVSGKMSAQATQRELVMTFLNKLGERIAFERTGVRLYDAFLVKLEAYRLQELDVQDVRHIRDEELEHFRMLCEVMSDFGGDPTCETPAADLTGVESDGLLKVVTDPRTNPTQCLSAIVTAELADNEKWATLTELAEGIGFTKEAERFHQAVEEEREHLTKARNWHAALLMGQRTHSPETERRAA